MTQPKTLVQHVLASNAIEGIFVGPGEALYDQHIMAACSVEVMGCAGALSRPIDIHRVLLPEMAGYRTCGVYVGGRAMPPASAVPELMAEWDGAYRSLLANLAQEPEPVRSSLAASEAELLQDWFLCIHPFQDGNGRTARLVMNSFRRAAGLDWHIVMAADRHAYYARIRQFEDSLFAWWHPSDGWQR